MTQPADAPSSRVEPETLAVVRDAQRQWRQELAELGGRNSLMWHQDLALGSIDLTVAHPGGVAKLLAGHATRLTELVRETVALAEARRKVSAIRSKSVELQREHGMTTAFLAVGMASWRLPRAPIPPRAPVLLRGARIHPADAGRQDYVLRLDQDVVFNPALEHYLRGELGLELDGHDLAQLSTGRVGFDPRPTYDALEQICAGVENFGIGPQLVLSTYPWAKLPLVAELAGPAERLAARPLIAGLAAVAEESDVAGVEDAGDDAEEGAVEGVATADDQAAPALHLLLEADRAQREVLSMVAAGRSAVLDAEPGTGRTQTIVNAVGQVVREEGTVLVAAEQRRALEGVLGRLRAIGLGALVLDVRDTPAGARRAAAELLEAIDVHRSSERPQPADPLTQDDPFEVLRAHESHLHRIREPWGVSLAQTQDVLTRLAGRERPPASRVRLGADVLAGLTPERMAGIRESLGAAVTGGAWQRGRSEDPWFGAQIATPEDAERAGTLVATLVSGDLEEARRRVSTLCARVGLPEPLNIRQWERSLDLLHRVRNTLDVFTPQVYEAPLEELVRATARRRDGKESGPEKAPTSSRGRLRRQARRLLRPGTPPPDLSGRLADALAERTEWQQLAGRAARPDTPRGWEEAREQFDPIRDDLAWLADRLEPTAYGKNLETTHLDLLLERLARLDARADRLPVVAATHEHLQPLRDRGLGHLVEDLAERGVAADDVESEADLVFWASVHDQITGADDHPDSAALRAAVDAVGAHSAARTEAARQDLLRVVWERIERTLEQHPGQEEALRAVVDAGPPLELTALLGAAPDLVRALRPCWLVSPLTIPATIPTDLTFDLAVLDETQRLPVARAVPTLTRAERVLVVGDSGGVPAVPFTSAVDERGGAESGSASLLHGASQVLDVHRLDTNYRVLDQRMIPARATARVHGFPGVLRAARITVTQARHREAQIAVVVDTVLEHARRSSQFSLGVLVDSAAVLPDIEAELWAAVARDGDLVGAFREDVDEPFLLNTVRRAAGDVRDRVLLVLTDTEDTTEDWALSALGSARRSVAVLIDRPLEELPDGPGVRLLRATVQQAGAVPESAAPESAAPESAAPEGAAPESAAPEPTSALVEDLAERLRVEGLTVRPRFGTGPQQIELVVDDPDDPGRPLLAIDTDAQPLGRVPDADRFLIRPLQLRRLGWTPVRVWTTDVFRDPAREVARLVGIAREASAARYRR